MGDRPRARLLGVVDEVPLGIQRRLLADDLHRVLVRPHGPVGAETVEDRPHHILGLFPRRRVVGDRGVRDIVDDPDREVAAGLGSRHLVEHAEDHRRGELLGGEPVAPGMDLDRSPGLGQGGDDVEVKRISHRSRLLGAIHDHHTLSGRWQ